MGEPAKAEETVYVTSCLMPTNGDPPNVLVCVEPCLPPDPPNLPVLNCRPCVSVWGIPDPLNPLSFCA